MSLLTEDFDISESMVVKDRLFRLLGFATFHGYELATPALIRLFDQIGSPVNPMKRLQAAESGIVVSYINEWYTELEFLTKFPGDSEFTNVIMSWAGANDVMPRVQRCWRGLSGISNRRPRAGRRFWLIPQDYMAMIYAVTSATPLGSRQCDPYSPVAPKPGNFVI